MAISGIKANTDLFLKLSTFKKINSAKDDAAGAAILEGLKSQKKGYDTGASNAASGKDMLSTAEGGLGSITDSLQRMRELSIQAGNATYTDDDRASIQGEIEQLKQNITSVTKNTEFNTKKLLDGSADRLHIASNPDGSGSNISIDSSALAKLGIEDYDVTNGNFNIEDIDDALKMVSSQRGTIGAKSNALDSTIAFNKLSSQNLSASSQRMEDLDVGKAVSDQKKEEILEQYRNFAQQAKQNQGQNFLNLINM